jgi:hypothetical protein
MKQLTAQHNAQTLVLLGDRAALASHQQGEGRYDRQGTPRAALSFVTTRWNRMTIPPRRALLSTPRDAP